MKKEVKNLPASVHERLKRQARQAGRPFQEFFYYYAIERFLYRLSASQYRDCFVLKGSLMFFGWGIPLRRPTRDIDLQGYLLNTVNDLEEVVRQICALDVEPDGMVYDPENVRGEEIIDMANYRGVRVFFTGYLGKAVIYLHIDVSFANVITPGELIINYPSMLGTAAFTLLGYPIETTIAEKLHAMVILENINDRMKDFFDIWLLAQRVDIAGKILVKAIRATFMARHTLIPEHIPIALSNEFARLRQPDWERFLKRSLLIEMGEISDFSLVIGALRQFLLPVLQVAFDDSSL